jgi:hypothetical protein
LDFKVLTLALPLPGAHLAARSRFSASARASSGACCVRAACVWEVEGDPPG